MDLTKKIVRFVLFSILLWGKGLPSLLFLESVDRQLAGERACWQKERHSYSFFWLLWTQYCQPPDNENTGHVDWDFLSAWVRPKNRRNIISRIVVIPIFFICLLYTMIEHIVLPSWISMQRFLCVHSFKKYEQSPPSFCFCTIILHTWQSHGI